jgi:hypothetical protein
VTRLTSISTTTVTKLAVDADKATAWFNDRVFQNLPDRRCSLMRCGDVFGSAKQYGTMCKTRHRGIRRVGADFMLNLIAHNLIRLIPVG